MVVISNMSSVFSSSKFPRAGAANTGRRCADWRLRRIRFDSRSLVAASYKVRHWGALATTSREGYGRFGRKLRAQRREDLLTDSAESASKRDNTMPQIAPTREVNVGDVGNGMFRAANFFLLNMANM